VKKYSLAFSFLALIVLANFSCKKINEATELGGGLIPPVDNVNTFDTSLSVEAFNGIFTDAEDSTRSTGISEQFLGMINNDPLFGKSQGTVFIELKPSFYPYSFPFKKDSLIQLDSIVMVLGYNSTYGDSTKAQQVAVSEITSNFRSDSAYLIRRNDFTLGGLLSPAKTFIPQTLNDSIFPIREQAANQLRIPLNTSFGQRLLNYDSTNAYRSDSAFKTYFKGFAVVPQNNGIANALIGLNLSDTNTKLAFYYRATINGVIDTGVVYFRATGLSATANYIKRDYAGSLLASYQGGSTPDDQVFIQNTPGTYASLRIPGLQNLSNRVVHRAELIVEQVADPLDDLFTPPQFLYLDAKDTGLTSTNYRTVPYDVGVTPSGQYVNFIPVYSIANAGTFGMQGKKSTDNSANSIYVWTFDLSRYVQHVVTHTEPVYDFRLSSPYFFKELVGNSKSSLNALIPINSNYGTGRVRVGGGNHATQKMRLRIIYSKL
jgi:hypothetical protein